MVGLPPSTTAGFHVHEGVSCDTTTDPGGHWCGDLDDDPWSSITYTSDANGVAVISISIDDYTLTGDLPVAGRGMSHDDNDNTTGTRISSSRSQLSVFTTHDSARGPQFR